MATRTVYSNTLVGQSAIQYIRAQTLTLHMAEARPDTKMYVFFDSVDVTSLCRNITFNSLGQPTGVSTATDITTNEAGECMILFKLPGNTFNTGSRQIVVTDSNNLGDLEINGSVWGSAKTVFKASGVLEIFQPKITVIDSTTVYIPPPRRQDPLAQSFFTYGVPGGIFLSSIDLFFHTKDSKLPVSVEIRPMVNGYPAPLPSNNPSLVSTKNAADVSTSSDASAATKFKFEPPIYLKDESDYCFVVTSNSKQYNIYTSRMGERSYETGLKIFNQPYVGSIFKSENNVTWTAEQFDDIKFNINKCVFDTTLDTTLDFATIVPPVAAFGDQFTTTSGSTTVRYRHKHEHGLEVGSILKIITKTEALYVNASFNGIPYAEFNDEHVVTAVIDRNTVEFQVSTQADTTGTIDSANIITGFDIVSGGTQFTSAATVEFVGNTVGAGATTAVGTPIIVNGKITGINLTNAGVGYKKAPAVNIIRNGGSGAAAQVTATVQAAFSVVTNKPMTGMMPNIVVSNYGTTSTENLNYTTLGNYTGGSLQTYAAGRTFEFTPQFPYANVQQNSLIASTYNETAKMNGDVSNKLRMKLKSNNSNLSPVINLNVRPQVNAYYTRINTQAGETLSATNYSGSLVAGAYPYNVNGHAVNGTVNITSQGAGYTLTPIVTISAPDYPEGVQATATATLTDGAVTSVTVVNAGSGYTSVPSITVTRADGDTTGAGAAIAASLTPFNTELRAKGGKAKARYITKKTSLKVVSTGIRLIATISSIQGASVDWYIRTSVSGSGVHEEQQWRLLTCESPRNKSSYIGEMFDYEFKLDNIPPFNTYDLKCVLSAQDPTKAPIVDGYRVIVVA